MRILFEYSVDFREKLGKAGVREDVEPVVGGSFTVFEPGSGTFFSVFL